MRAVISGAGTRVPPEGHDSEWLPASKVSHPPTSRQACRTNDHWSALHASKSTQPDKVTKILNLNLLWQVLPLTIRTNHIQEINPVGSYFRYSHLKHDVVEYLVHIVLGSYFLSIPT